MEHYDDGEVNFGPLIDLNPEDFCPTVRTRQWQNCPFQLEAACLTVQDTKSNGTVDQVLKAITALSVGIEQENNALEDRFGELSKRLDALESKQGDHHVTLATDYHKSDIPDLFGDPEEECFSAPLATLSPSPYNQLPQQREKPCVCPSPYNGSTSWQDYKPNLRL